LEFPAKTVCVPLFSPTRTTRPAHLNFYGFNYPNNNWWVVQTMEVGYDHMLQGNQLPIFRTKGKVYVAAGMSEDEDIFVHYLLFAPTNAHISFPFSFLSLGVVGFICIRCLFWCLSIIMLHYVTFLDCFFEYVFESILWDLYTKLLSDFLL
jgi:hypothetical protein